MKSSKEKNQTEEIKKKIETLSSIDLQRIHSILFTEDFQSENMVSEIITFNGYMISNNDNHKYITELLMDHIKKHSKEDIQFFAEFFGFDTSKSYDQLCEDIQSFVCQPYIEDENKEKIFNLNQKKMKTKKEQKEESIIEKLKQSEDKVYNELKELRKYMEQQLQFELFIPNKRKLENKNDILDTNTNNNINNDSNLVDELLNKPSKQTFTNTFDDDMTEIEIFK